MTQPASPPSGVPRIFSPARRAARFARAMVRQRTGEAATFLLDEIAEDMAERLAFVRHDQGRHLVLGDAGRGWAVIEGGAKVETIEDFDPEQPFASGGFDTILVHGLLDAVNDLPGALIHIRNALRPGGLAIASFVGGGSLPALRTALLAGDGEHPAARIHPLVDPRAAPGLLQRAGWKDPVVDTLTLKVRYGSLDRLVADLRDQGLGNALVDAGAPLGKAALARARAAFLDQADADGRVTERFELVTLTGRRSLEGT